MKRTTGLSLGRNLRRGMLLVTVALTALATTGIASTLTLIPIPSWATNNMSGSPNYKGVMRQSEARAITPDGVHVVGICFDYNYTNSSQTMGYFYNTTNSTTCLPVFVGSDGKVASWASMCAGVGYRVDSDGTPQTVMAGISGGYPADFMTSDGGVTWGWKCRNTTIPVSTLPYANALGATAGQETFYSLFTKASEIAIWIYNNAQEHYIATIIGHWYAGISPTVTYPYVSIEHPGSPPIINGGMLCGVSPFNGRAVGWKQNNDTNSPDYQKRYNYVVEYPPNGYEGTCWMFHGLINEDNGWGACWSINQDGTVVFGHSPTSVGSPWYGYKAKLTQTSPVVESVTKLPDLPGVGGTNYYWWAIPYGCSADGGYATGVETVGTLGAERAVLWDTRDSDPNNWTVTDLTALAAAEGILSPFISLSRGYSVGVNAAGQPVVAGFGKTTDGTTVTNRAFVMVVAPVPPRPQITSVTGAGTGTITVNYTNTVAGKTYTLLYNTNLNTTDWYSAGSKAATGTSDSQTESSVTSAQRYYRVSYTP